MEAIYRSSNLDLTVLIKILSFINPLLADLKETNVKRYADYDIEIPHDFTQHIQNIQNMMYKLYTPTDRANFINNILWECLTISKKFQKDISVFNKAITVIQNIIDRNTADVLLCNYIENNSEFNCVDDYVKYMLDTYGVDIIECANYKPDNLSIRKLSTIDNNIFDIFEFKATKPLLKCIKSKTVNIEINSLMQKSDMVNYILNMHDNEFQNYIASNSSANDIIDSVHFLNEIPYKIGKGNIAIRMSVLFYIYEEIAKRNFAQSVRYYNFYMVLIANDCLAYKSYRAKDMVTELYNESKMQLIRDGHTRSKINSLLQSMLKFLNLN